MINTVFKIEEFKEDCSKKLANVTRAEGLNRMDLSRLRRGVFSKGLSVDKFLFCCKAMNVSPEVYTVYDLEF